LKSGAAEITLLRSHPQEELIMRRFTAINSILIVICMEVIQLVACQYDIIIMPLLFMAKCAERKETRRCTKVCATSDAFDISCEPLVLNIWGGIHWHCAPALE
jgi:hypothetical protein